MPEINLANYNKNSLTSKAKLTFHFLCNILNLSSNVQRYACALGSEPLFLPSKTHSTTYIYRSAQLSHSAVHFPSGTFLLHATCLYMLEERSFAVCVGRTIES